MEGKDMDFSEPNSDNKRWIKAESASCSLLSESGDA
jgi:hypothetical protein